MQLTVWTYEGPPHVGAMRIATAMTGLHYVLHAPQGDTYADLLFTMIERRGQRPPVTYTTFQARDLGTDTAILFQTACREAYARFEPQAMIVGASCTAELIQDDPAGMAQAMALPIPVIPLELPSYQRKENWGAAETFYQLVRTLSPRPSPARHPLEGGDPSAVHSPEKSDVTGSRLRGNVEKGSGSDGVGGGRARPTANILGPTALGFRHRDDIIEVTRLLDSLGVDINVIAPLGASPADLARLGDADINVLLYPEIGDPAARWLENNFGQKTIRTVPIGHGATRDFLREVAAALDIYPEPALAADPSRLPWWSRSVDSTYLTGKRVFVFGDATHAIAAARVAVEELGFELVGLGCYNREFARELRAAAARYGVEPLITDDYLAVEEAIERLQPELVLGTQMERHIAKRLRLPCAVISAPVHVQDFPARYSPQMGWEGANVLFDTWVHPLVMGLEEHLLTMFRDDFEFHDGAGASHLGGAGSEGGSVRPSDRHAELVSASIPASDTIESAEEWTLKRVQGDEEKQDALWSADAEQELRKIPFFVRGKARRNTEAFAAERGLAPITIETLYDAKSHFAR